MRLAVLKECRRGETRAAASPETVRKLVALNCEVVVQQGAGLLSNISDSDFIAAGANIAATAAETCSNAQVTIKVATPLTGDEGPDEIGILKSGSILVANMRSATSHVLLNQLAERNVTTFALEMLPRISRAQSMDALSSQANLAGYRAVIEAAESYGGILPMMTTAAGTIIPARVFVFGAGVAGLQAIATAKRLGAVVTATDVRPVTKEQVESLGAKFVTVDAHKSTTMNESKNGYAAETSDESQRRQEEALREELIRSDIIITTAMIPGRAAPRLISADTVAKMKSGSVIVDIAAEAGGNVEGVRQDQCFTTGNGVTIIGHTNLAARVPQVATALFARNVFHFLKPMINGDNGDLAVDWDDDIISGTLATREGRVMRHA